VYRIIGADGKEYGPITIEVLRQWLDEGRANGQTRVLPEGASDWKTIAEIPELAALLSKTAAFPTTPGPISITATPRNNSFAMAGLTLGILALTLGLCCCYGLPFSIPGIVCSSIGLNQIKNDPNTQLGRNLAIGGLVLSVLSILVGALLLVLGITHTTPDMIRRIHRL
jgi:hypothetical protein